MATNWSDDVIVKAVTGEFLRQTTNLNGDSGSNADPQTTTSAYDAMGNQLWSIPATGQSLVQGPTNPYATSTTYTPENQPSVVTEPDGIQKTYTYDQNGNVLEIATGTGDVESYGYDGDNRLCAQVVGVLSTTLKCAYSSSTKGSTITSYVPGSDSPYQVTDGNGNTTTYYYGDLAYPTQATEVVDATGSQTSYSAFDDFGNTCLTGSVPITLGATQCQYIAGDTGSTFNALNNQLSLTDPSGNVTTYAYSNTAYPSLETSATSPIGTTSYSYDADGNLTTTTNPDGSAVTSTYDVDGRVCELSENSTSYPCNSNPGVAGLTTYGYTYNDASERTSSTQYTSTSSAATTYGPSLGQLASVTDANGKTVSYLYNYAGQIACVAYPVSTSSGCGTIASPATGSGSNTIQTRTYDSSGRLASTTDWLGNTIAYTYADAWDPTAPTSISYPSSTGLSATYSYDADGNLTGLSGGSSINDSWTYNVDEQVATTTINGSTSGTVTYNANHQITAATNLGASNTNDVYTVAPNGEITQDVPGSGTTTSSSFNSGDELCSVKAGGKVTPCGSTPSNGTSYAYTANGERSLATPYTSGRSGTKTYYGWNSLGELCNVATTSTSCGVTPASGTSYQYNGDELRTSETTSTSTTDSTWDVVSGGSIPLNINDATTASGTTSNTSYLYGNLLFGGTAPVEQITTTSSGATADFLVANPTGVQGVVNASGATLELAVYSPYGTQKLQSGTSVTPFGFQGSYVDRSTGLIYLINRYYDPSTEQFLSVDPDVQTTDQPFSFANDDPLNAEDPLGLCIRKPSGGCVSAPKPKDNTTPRPKSSSSSSSTSSSTKKAGVPEASSNSSTGSNSGQPSTVSKAGAIITASGAGIAGLGGPLINIGEGAALVGGGETVGIIGLGLVTAGTGIAVIGLGVLLYSAFKLW